MVEIIPIYEPFLVIKSVKISEHVARLLVERITPEELLRLGKKILRSP